MNNSTYSLFLSSLKLNFLHITDYNFDYTWKIQKNRIIHNVLWYMKTGEIHLTVNETSYTAKKGDLIFLPAMAEITAHAITSRLGIVSINFDAEFNLVKSRPWTDIFKLPVQFQNYDISLIEPVIDQMLNESKEPSFAQIILLQSSLHRIIALMFNQYIQVPSNEALFIIDHRVKLVIEYISLHPTSFPDIAELCQMVQVSESHLRKLFIENTGLTPITFIRHFKIEQAQNRLLSSTERVADIAYQLGFNDANYFSRLFKKRTGYSPQDYRQRL